MIRNSKAQWNGSLKDGSGTMALGGGAYEGPYSFSSRFESGTGTNPEELIAAAHAGCFSMALSLGLEKAGSPPASIRTTADVRLDRDGEGFTVTGIDLTTVAVVPGMDDAKFQAVAEATKKGCPVSKALAAVGNITLKASLASA